MCADGRKQQNTSINSDATSLTMYTESVLTTAVIDASVNLDVEIVDVPGALITTDMDEDVILVLEGYLAKIMEAISPSIYREYVSVGKKGRNILYVRLQKALYGCLLCDLLL